MLWILLMAMCDISAETAIAAEKKEKGRYRYSRSEWQDREVLYGVAFAQAYFSQLRIEWTKLTS